ncbi:hypothetical protein OO013_01975 [Mangrovivirga sp. M17]|uniref:Uncharacterized protein n=1 Tax=Mangrovivirga halotolerans TaxID=2993936 RepID=A0ABT3RMB2_9BACT|nr:hypothetical protein [Mangrovivirga halotolerans]MCX2742611.1 hypothetical protein [Mangrovivirga halotolerans]
MRGYFIFLAFFSVISVQAQYTVNPSIFAKIRSGGIFGDHQFGEINLNYINGNNLLLKAYYVQYVHNPSWEYNYSLS